jgi:hypothetical protein
MDIIESDNKRWRLIAAVVCSISTCTTSPKYIVVDRLPNRCDALYNKVLEGILKIKQQRPALFSRIYHLSPASFDKVLSIIKPELLPIKRTAKYFVPPLIKLCLGLCVLAGGSYLDLSVGYDVPHNCVHFYAWQALHATHRSTDPFIDNIKSPIFQTAEELEKLE